MPCQLFLLLLFYTGSEDVHVAPVQNVEKQNELDQQTLVRLYAVVQFYNDNQITCGYCYVIYYELCYISSLLNGIY